VIARYIGALDGNLETKWRKRGEKGGSVIRTRGVKKSLVCPPGGGREVPMNERKEGKQLLIRPLLECRVGHSTSCKSKSRRTVILVRIQNSVGVKKEGKGGRSKEQLMGGQEV